MYGHRTTAVLSCSPRHWQLRPSVPPAEKAVTGRSAKWRAFYRHKWWWPPHPPTPTDAVSNWWCHSSDPGWNVMVFVCSNDWESEELGTSHCDPLDSISHSVTSPWPHRDPGPGECSTHPGGGRHPFLSHSRAIPSGSSAAAGPPTAWPHTGPLQPDLTQPGTPSLTSHRAPTAWPHTGPPSLTSHRAPTASPHTGPPSLTSHRAPTAWPQTGPPQPDLTQGSPAWPHTGPLQPDLTQPGTPSLTSHRAPTAWPHTGPPSLTSHRAPTASPHTGPLQPDLTQGSPA